MSGVYASPLRRLVMWSVLGWLLAVFPTGALDFSSRFR